MDDSIFATYLNSPYYLRQVSELLNTSAGCSSLLDRRTRESARAGNGVWSRLHAVDYSVLMSSIWAGCSGRVGNCCATKGGYTVRSESRLSGCQTKVKRVCPSMTSYWSSGAVNHIW